MAHRGEAHLTIVTKLVDEIRLQDAVQTIVIEPNKILHGKSGATHQVDVYWEFVAGTKASKYAIEAKHWDKPVSRRELNRFRAVLSDLQGQHKGVFVASSGYQKRARNYAERYGIDIYIFPFTIEMTDDNVTFFIPRFERIAPVFDEEWIESVLMPKLRQGGSLAVSARSPDEQTHLFDEHCAAKTVREVLHEHYLAEIREMRVHEICIRFDRPTYVDTGDQNAPMLKVNGLDALFSVTSHAETFKRVSKDFAHGAVEFMLTSALAGQ
ncbi:MAG: restriction endonuclease [Halobacteriota archaeon]